MSGENYEIYIGGTSKESTWASSGAHTVATSGSDVTEEYSLKLEFIEPTGKFTALRIHVQATVTGDFSECVIQPNFSEINLINAIYSGTGKLINVTITEISGAGADYTETRVNETADAASNLLAGYQNANYILPPEIELIAQYIADYDAGLDETISGWVYVHDVYLKGTVSLDFTNEAEAAEKFIADLEFLYCGADGLDADFTDGSGAPAIEVHEVHRDIMNRFAGIDFDNDYMANWAALATARSNWKVRLWLLEPILIKELLEQLQFEGCFIFTLTADSDGSGTSGGRYIWVKDSYVNSDFPGTDGDPVVQVFDETDYVNLSIGHTDLFEIITKTTYRFNKHPALNKYVGETSYDNTTDRDKWNLGTDHFELTDLDFLVGSTNANNEIYHSGLGDNTPNESIVLYRDNLQSEPKTLVDIEITNKKKMNVEYGDIVQFNDSNVNPYGESWADLFFMVISERRSKMGLSITAKKVYKA